MKKFKLLILSISMLFTASLASCQFLNSETLIDDRTENTQTKTNNDESKAQESEESKDIISTESKKEETGSSTGISKESSILDLLEDYTEFYGYQKLGEDTNYGEIMQEAYATYFDACKDFIVSNNNLEKKVVSGNDYYPIEGYKVSSADEAKAIYATVSVFCMENPLFYFLPTSYSTFITSSGSKTTYTVNIECSLDYLKASTRKLINAEILEFVDDANLKYDELLVKNDYTKAKMIHDFIIDRINYDYATVINYSNSSNENVYYKFTDAWGTYYLDTHGDVVTPTASELSSLTASESYKSPNKRAFDHNILGAVESKAGVCECYAKAYKLLCDYYDIKTLLITGNATSGGSSGGHAWNYTCISNKWYGVDVTWDDQATISYEYFLCSKSKMNTGHFPFGNTAYSLEYNVELPTLSSNKYTII